MILRITSFFLLISLWSCSHLSNRDPLVTNSTTVDQNPSIEVKRFEISKVQEDSLPKSSGERIPVIINPLVEQWIKYFQGRGRHHMERYLARSTRYGELMRRILRENGMPEDLIFIALIESGFSSRAVSHASAVGYWQFIKPTGRRYNLEVSSLIDERRDPVLSTHAAAQYFKELYEMFGSWYLAMASYNAGENRIMRLIKKYRTNDFWELAKKKRALPKETLHYVPKFIAAKLIAEDPIKYGFTDIEYEAPLEFEIIEVKNPVDLRIMAQNLEMDYDDLKLLNPKFKGPLAPLNKDQVLILRVPLGQAQKGVLAAKLSQVDMSTIAYYRSEDLMTHKVRRGETLSTIAKRYKTTVAIIRDLNDLKPTRRLRVGQRLDVPRRRSISSAAFVSSSPGPALKSPNQKASLDDLAEQSPAQEEKPKYHIVAKGDTLTGIAEEYDITIGELVKLNNLKRKSTLPIGLRLKLPDIEELPDAVTDKEGVRHSPAARPQQEFRNRTVVKQSKEHLISCEEVKIFMLLQKNINYLSKNLFWQIS